MANISWIQLSDLHLGDDIAVDTHLMRERLPDYISSLNVNFDYAFCTGDIKQWNSNYSGADDYLKSICTAANVQLGNLYVVPGNHDVNISDDDHNGRKELIHKLTDWKTDYYLPSVGVISDDDLRVLQSGRTEFIDFIRDVFGDSRASLYKQPHFVITTSDFNILHVDSTLTYTSDHQRDFIVGTGLLMDALDQCDKSKPTILLTHYSFDFLEQNEKNEVETLLSSYNVQLWLAGHEHQSLIRKQRDKFIECQCGNLALQKGARSCFLVGNFNTDTGEGDIAVHAWYESKGWELYPFARTGTEDNSHYPFQLRLPGNDGTYKESDVSEELANCREAYCNLSAAGGLFYRITVKPSILTDLEYDGKIHRYDDKNAKYPFEEIIDDLWLNKNKNDAVSCNALIVGDGGFGKSTAMYHTCGTLLHNRQSAVYISLQMLEGNNEDLQSFILRCLYKKDDERTRHRFINLVSISHTHPDLILFIDGFNELTGKGAQRYVAQIKALAAYHGVQIIISSRLNFLRDYGLSYFELIQPCDLREVQIKQLFAGRDNDWKQVSASKSLLVLLKNPMMALLYADTCPVVEQHKDLDYLDWILPIKNASDLLHDYYFAQIASMIDRTGFSADKVIEGMIALRYVLPGLALNAEENHTVFWRSSFFESVFAGVLKTVNTFLEKDRISDDIKTVMRKFRTYPDHLNANSIYDLIFTELCLLRSGNGLISFKHQIYRDYLSAVCLHHCLVDQYSVDRLWRHNEIHSNVIQYLRFIDDEELWGNDEKVNHLLKDYRGKEAEDDDYFVKNIVHCWLLGPGEVKGLSDLDLRKVPLTDALKLNDGKTINIDHTWVSKETFVNDRKHDRIIAICFSHDCRTMAAVSANGIISITNLISLQQMIIDQLKTNVIPQSIGFDIEDDLIVVTNKDTFKWPTITYDQKVSCSEKDIVILNTIGEAVQNQVNHLLRLLNQSGLQGTCQKVSENGHYIAVGFESGFIQVYEVMTQNCLASLSLSDTQISAAAFTKDGKIAAINSGSRIVQIWNVVEKKCIRILYLNRRVNRLMFSEDDSLICQFSTKPLLKINLDTNEQEYIALYKTQQFVSDELIKELKKKHLNCQTIKTSPNGNAIVLTNSGNAYTWDEDKNRMNECPGHKKSVCTIAICDNDGRFAASYSPEIYHATRQDGKRRGLLNNQRLVRVIIVKTGQCQWRLPTKGRTIVKLQFFTSNRIILAGFASNGDILLWELTNKIVKGEEHGKWDQIGIVENNQAEPVECAVSLNKNTFISAYADGSIVVRPFVKGSSQKTIFTIPGINADKLKWDDLKCDEKLKSILDGYNHQLRSIG